MFPECSLNCDLSLQAVKPIALARVMAIGQMINKEFDGKKRSVFANSQAAAVYLSRVGFEIAKGVQIGVQIGVQTCSFGFCIFCN